MSKFTIDYLSAVKAKLDTVEKDFTKGYTVDIAGDFKTPPLMEMVRYITEMGEVGGISSDSKERIVKIAILNQAVAISYKGKPLGTFTINNMSDPLDGFDVLRNNPSAMLLLVQIALSKMLEKFLPPPDASDPLGAARAMPGSPQP